jgi:Flp pilus assembly protein CpaB
MNRLGLIIRQKIFIIVFIILMIIGAVVIYLYLSSSDSTKKDSMNNCKVFIAKNDISAGTEINMDLLDCKSIPAKLYSESFIVLEEDILGRKVNYDISKGDIISTECLEDGYPLEENYSRFSSYIPAGLRAISIPVDYYGDISILNCGDRIDIISTFYDKNSDLLVSSTVLSDKEIILIEGKSSKEYITESHINPSNTKELSVIDEVFNGENIRNGSSEQIIITLYLKPEEVERVFLSIELGSLNISVCPRRQLTDY